MLWCCERTVASKLFLTCVLTFLPAYMQSPAGACCAEQPLPSFPAVTAAELRVLSHSFACCLVLLLFVQA